MKEPSIQLAEGFPLPAAIVTESVMIIGRKGSGKTNTAGVLFEQMFGIGAQCVALDPVGNWYGLRLSASGKRTGLDIPVFGGDHGDVPITPQGGKLMAQVVVDRNISCVIDLMSFRPSHRKEFVTAFAQELFELKKRKKTPLHLFVEEARLFAPQQMKGKLDVEMCDAFEQIVRLGRNYGLGVSLLDQRPQSVNKEVSSQTELLVVHQMTERLGRKEIEDWVRAKTTTGAEALDELDSLRTGEAFVWSPGMLRKFARIKVDKKKTYDASKTPELGEAVDVAPRPLSGKELGDLRTAMAEVVKQAEENDVGKLRVRIRQLEALQRHPVTAETVVRSVEKVIEIPVMDPKVVDALMALESKVAKALSPIQDAIVSATQLIARTTTELAKRKIDRPSHALEASSLRPQALGRSGRTTIAKPRETGNVEDTSMPGPERRILEALAWMESIGISEPENVAVAFLAGYSPGGGAYGNPRGALRKRGLIDYRGSRLTLTAEGRTIAPAVTDKLTTAGLHAAVLDRLPGPEQRLLKPLLEAYPNDLDLAELAAAAGYAPEGGAFGNPKGRLRTLGLATYPTKGRVRAADLLFLGA